MKPGDADVPFTPQMIVEKSAAKRGISVEDIGVAPITVVCWGLDVARSLAEQMHLHPSPNWLYGERQPFFTGSYKGCRVCVVLAPVGASGTVLLMEEMIACGARAFLGLGWTGSLQPSAPIGTFVIPTSGIREEGTSHHYLESAADVGPDTQLADLFLRTARADNAPVVSGPIWTTDAPYRELLEKVERFRRQGILSVDMETTAMYALGQFRSVKVCNLLVVSDELWQGYREAFRSAQLCEATDRAQRLILRCLESSLLIL